MRTKKRGDATGGIQPCSTPSSSDLSWSVQIFNFGMGAVVLSVAAFLQGSRVGLTVLVLSLAIALLSRLTPFCIGRLLYVSLFRPRTD